MSNQPNIKYFIHDGGANLEPSGESNASLTAIFAGVDRSEPHYASAASLLQLSPKRERLQLRGCPTAVPSMPSTP